MFFCRPVVDYVLCFQTPLWIKEIQLSNYFFFVPCTVRILLHLRSTHSSRIRAVKLDRPLGSWHSAIIPKSYTHIHVVSCSIIDITSYFDLMNWCCAKTVARNFLISLSLVIEQKRELIVSHKSPCILNFLLFRDQTIFSFLFLRWMIAWLCSKTNILKNNLLFFTHITVFS